MARVARRPLDHVPGFGHVRLSFRDLLATLLRDDLAEFLVALSQFVVDVPQVLRAIDRRQFPPLLEGLVRRLEGRVDICSVPRWNVASVSPVAGLSLSKVSEPVPFVHSPLM